MRTWGIAVLILSFLATGCQLLPTPQEPEVSSSSAGPASEAAPSASLSPASASISQAPSPEPSPEPTTYPPVAPIVVMNDDIWLSRSDVASLQKYADDLAAGAIDEVKRKCWTQSSWFIDQVFARRAEVLDALSREPLGADTGFVWGNVDVDWAELHSRYSCPDLDVDFHEADLRLFVTRLDARLKGTPYREADTDENYPLVCDYIQEDSADFVVRSPVSFNVATTMYPPEVVTALSRLASAGPIESEQLEPGFVAYWPANNPELKLVVGTFRSRPGCVVGANAG